MSYTDFSLREKNEMFLNKELNDSFKLGDTVITNLRDLEDFPCSCNRNGKTTCKIDLSALPSLFKDMPVYREVSYIRRTTVKLLLEKWLIRGQRVLDVGCAEGRIWDEVELDLEIHGLDQCPRRLGLYPCTGKKSPLGLSRKFTSLTISEAEALPYEDNSFDVCTFFELIEHILDVESFLREIYRVLRPGGRIILSTPNVASLGNRLGLLFGKGFSFHFSFWENGFFPLCEYNGKPYSSDGIRYPEQLQHIRFFTHESIGLCLGHTGFGEVRSFGLSSWLNGRWASRELKPISQFIAASRLKNFLSRIFCTAVKDSMESQ